MLIYSQKECHTLSAGYVYKSHYLPSCLNVSREIIIYADIFVLKENILQPTQWKASYYRVHFNEAVKNNNKEIESSWKHQ